MMSHSLYDFLRHLADSWGLLAMAFTFLILASWPFRPGAKERNRDAAMAIFEDQSHDE